MRELLLRASRLDVPYPRKLPGIGRPSAVLALFALRNSGDSTSLSVLLTRRTQTVESHKGQIAFPGGRLDPDDDLREGLKTTALRETEEEVGIPGQSVEVLGQLPVLSTLTGYVITPFVGWLSEPHGRIPLSLCTGEIAEAVWVPWSRLRDLSVYSREPVAGGIYVTDVFQVDDFRIWGATAAILKNLIDRMEALESTGSSG